MQDIRAHGVGYVWAQVLVYTGNDKRRSFTSILVGVVCELLSDGHDQIVQKVCLVASGT
jgi:hypothetical protein